MVPTPWQKRFRRLAVAFGTISSLYLLLNFALDRMREARVRGMKDRQVKDRLRSHFNSLISTISFTLYALLPTLQPQLFERYPIENTSQALQGMSMTSSVASIQPERAPSQDSEAGHGLQLNRGGSETGTSATGEEASSAVGESWASEFQRRDGEGHDGRERDALSSTTSQSLSLPTDMSSDSNSPPSNLSSSVMLSPSPPRRSPPSPPRSKKDLWKDLKVQSIAKSMTTAYLVPLLLILTSSQLSTLARVKYLKDVKSSLPTPSSSSRPITTDEEDEDDQPVYTPPKPKSGWFNYFSVEAMGLADYVDNSTSSAGGFVSGLIPKLFGSAPKPSQTDVEIFDQEDEQAKADAERLFLTYSWWLLHEGWRGVADRVDEAVERVFSNMPLKREISVDEWHAIIKEVRAIVETNNESELHDFTQHVLPPLQMSSIPLGCPLPTHPGSSPYLMDLLAQTRQQLSSADGRYLLDKGVSEMVRSLCDSLRNELYISEDLQSIPSRRLVDCLPEFNRWAKGVWEGIPDSGVEGLLALPEYENFAALVFGDWA